VIRRLQCLSYEERLSEFGLLRPEKRSLHRDLIAALQCPEGAYIRAGEGLFTRARRDRTRCNDFKLKG